MITVCGVLFAICLASITYYLGLSKGEKEADTIRLELSEMMKTVRAQKEIENHHEDNADCDREEEGTLSATIRVASAINSTDEGRLSTIRVAEAVNSAQI